MATDGACGTIKLDGLSLEALCSGFPPGTPVSTVIIGMVIGDPTETRGLILLAQSGGIPRHLPELYGSACL